MLLQDPKKPAKNCVLCFLLCCGRFLMQFILYFWWNILTCPRVGTPKYVTDVGPLNLCRVHLPLSWVYASYQSKTYPVWLAWYHWYSRPNWYSVVCPDDPDYFMTESRRVNMAWGKPINEYSYSFQVNASCFWSSFPVGLKKRALARAMTTYHTSGAKLLCLVKKLQLGLLAVYIYKSSIVIFQVWSAVFRCQIGILNVIWSGPSPGVLKGGTNICHYLQNALFLIFNLSMSSVEWGHFCSFQWPSHYHIFNSTEQGSSVMAVPIAIYIYANNYIVRDYGNSYQVCPQIQWLHQARPEPECHYSLALLYPNLKGCP